MSATDRPRQSAFRIVSAAVTPFDSSGRIDTESAARLFEWGLRCGLDGFFVFGNMGEWRMLNDSMRSSLAAVVCDVVRDRARIILGVHATDLTGVLENMDHLADFHHSHWAALLPPGNGPQDDPVRQALAIADHADRPFLLYYVPKVNGVRLTTAQFREILDHPNVAGIKNSASLIRVRKELLLLKRELDFELFEGDEWGVDEAAHLGCDGAVIGFGSMGGRLFKAIAAAAGNDDWVRAAWLQRQLIDILHTVYGEPVAYQCVGQKYGLHRMGILDSYNALLATQQTLPPEQQERIARCVEEHPEWFDRRHTNA